MRKNRSGITPQDLSETKKIFDDNGWPLPQRYFRYSASLDKWELYRIQPNGTKTLLASMYDDVHWEWLGQ